MPTGRKLSKSIRAVLTLLTAGLVLTAGCSTSPSRAALQQASSRPFLTESTSPAATPIPSWPTDADRRRAARMAPSTTVLLRDLRVPAGHDAAISLSFDDGPSPYTDAVLGLLQQWHVHAVFCLIGIKALQRPADVRREVAAGNDLCDHSRDHSPYVRSRNVAFVTSEVQGGLRDIQSVDGGAAVPFYRQPFGYWTPTVVRIMYRNHLDPLRWSDDPRDWSRPGAVTIAARVLRSLRPGAVILLHDGGGDRRETLTALRWLLPHLLAAHWRLVLPVPMMLPMRLAARPE